VSGGVILVRHAMPAIVPSVSSKLWELDEHAKEDCVLLAHALPKSIASPVIASGQRKAEQTAAVIALRLGLQTLSDERVREVEQTTGWIEGNYRAVAMAYLGGDTGKGWEARDDVATRFAAAVGEARSTAGERDVVIVNHGLALSLYLQSLSPEVLDRDGRRPFDIVPFWCGLTLPDAWRLDIDANTIERIFEGGILPED
jgi:broad specificity phosphatase PhoE